MSRTFRAGLIVFGLLSAGDLAGPLLTDGEHPPMSVALIGSALGLVSLVLVVLAWRGTRRAVVPLIVLRVLSGLSAVPAFFAGDVPPGAMVAAGLTIALAAAGTVLVLMPARQLVGAR
jgi:CHASE2 domain-containing sensor protein